MAAKPQKLCQRALFILFTKKIVDKVHKMAIKIELKEKPLQKSYKNNTEQVKAISN